MSSRPRSPTPSFGGWNDYQLWADHDFLPRRSNEDPEPTEEESSADERTGTDRPEVQDLAPTETIETIDYLDDDPELVEWPSPADAQPYSPEPLPEDDTALLVRPYTRTGGRTQGCYELAIETLVSITEFGRSINSLSGDHRSISLLCAHPVSVAEIAAGLHVPISVAQVLISDMAKDSLVFIHHGDPVTDDHLSVEFMQRVLAGLRAL
ncbi:MAG TPA: DUF742 domain-containing protein [Pseudonocardiaceae bacterium]|jgi:hypothetical protein|nr:DUF742 domain-containing protein [Pseudonocardiaceae bacterium]